MTFCGRDVFKGLKHHVFSYLISLNMFLLTVDSFKHPMVLCEQIRCLHTSEIKQRGIPSKSQTKAALSWLSPVRTNVNFHLRLKPFHQRSSAAANVIVEAITSSRDMQPAQNRECWIMDQMSFPAADRRSACWGLWGIQAYNNSKREHIIIDKNREGAWQ